MDLREAVARELRAWFESCLKYEGIGFAQEADRILALCSADVVRREREAFVACYDWMSQNGPDAHDPEAEALRRYPEGGKR